MKTFTTELAAHYESGETTLALCLRITRSDSQVFRFTSVDHAFPIDGDSYTPGLQVSALAHKSGLATNNLEITVLYDDTFLKVDFLAGRWVGARWEIFEANWAAPDDGINLLGTYTTGEVTPSPLACVVELRSKADALQKTVGYQMQRTCAARFADWPKPVPLRRCRLSAATYTVTGTITSVASRQLATDSARAEAADWFGEGVLTFTGGENTGLAQKVKAFSAGAFTFSLPFPFAIGVGDTYSVIAGCRKRFEEDCRLKHNNAINFQGAPHAGGSDALTASPEVSV